MTFDSDKVIRVDGQSSFKLDSQTELTRIRSYQWETLFLKREKKLGSQARFDDWLSQSLSHSGRIQSWCARQRGIKP